MIRYYTFTNKAGAPCYRVVSPNTIQQLARHFQKQARRASISASKAKNDPQPEAPKPVNHGVDAYQPSAIKPGLFTSIINRVKSAFHRS